MANLLLAALIEASNWKRIRLEYIDTEEKKILARLIANWHRRQVSREEKEQWINALAEIYLKQGYKVGDRTKREPNEIIRKISEVTGLTVKTIMNYIHDEFKQERPEEIRETQKPRVPASQAIEQKESLTKL